MSLKFHGLSSPDELIKMWRELRYDNDNNDMNVIWDYESPKQLKKGFNIINVLYNPEIPDETGHYVLITVNDGLKEVEYFNPVANRSGDDKDKLKDLLKYFTKKGYDVNINLEGKQHATSENCGFHCLTHAYNYYIDESNKMWPKAEVEVFNGEAPSAISRTKSFEGFNNDELKQSFINDLIENYKVASMKQSKSKESKGGAAQTGDFEEDLLKVVRGIYYGLKYGFDQTTPARKTKKNKDTSGAGLADYKPRQFSYTGLRDEMEN